MTIEEAKQRVLFFVKNDDETAARTAMNEIVKATIDALRCEASDEEKPAGWRCPVCVLEDRRYYEDIIRRLKELENCAVQFTWTDSGQNKAN